MNNYLHDCSGTSSPASSSSDVTSIMRRRLAGGEPRLAATCRGSSLAFDRRSPAARLCCRNAETSTSLAPTVPGDNSFRFPARSRGRNIFDTQKKKQWCRKSKTTALGWLQNAAGKARYVRRARHQSGDCGRGREEPLTSASFRTYGRMRP
jgi:hypothetical protein